MEAKTKKILTVSLVAIAVTVLLVVVHALTTKKKPALESAEDVDDYGTGLLGSIRRLFKHHPKKASGLSTEQKTKIDMTESLKANEAYFKIFNSSATETSHAKTIVKELEKDGVTDVYTIAGILAVVSKESNFILKRENLDYTAPQLEKVFGLPAADATRLAHKPEEIAAVVYMPPHNTQLGNTQPGDAWFFRGAGWNQLTGRGNAAKVGSKIGVDLVADFDKLNDPVVATDALLAFFKDGLIGLKSSNLTKIDGTKVNHMVYYNNPTGDINGFKNEQDAAAAIYNINAGLGQTEKFLLADVTGGRALTMARASGFVNWIRTNTQAA
jgi:predicted chitinase